MPIITVQRRMAEQGRIRLGQKVATASGKQRPDKLDRFRFTSPNQGLIEQIAAKYGGDARPWDNAGKREFEVISDARAIPVIVIKGGFSQWHETWSKAGLQHRCDGEKDPAGVYCDPDDPAHVEAIQKPTTRLSVMLAEIETLGTWRMESKGWNAAAELPSMAELAMHVGDYVPATLSLAERSSIIETDRGSQTSRFVVPVLDLRVTKARLVEIAGATSAPAPVQISGTAPAQIGAPAGGMDADDWGDAVADATSADELREIWTRAGKAGALTNDLKARITNQLNEIAEAAKENQGEYVAEHDEPSDEPIDRDEQAASDGDIDLAWQTLLSAAGDAGVGQSNLRAMLEQEYAAPVAELTADQMLDFIPKLGDAA